MRSYGLGFLLIVILSLAAAATVAVTGAAEWRLADPDAYLRMIRVMDLRDGASWFDHVTFRIAAPDGLSMHWTRPLDLLILLPGLAVLAMTGVPARYALLAAGIVLSPALMLTSMLAVAWAARGLWQGNGGLAAALFLPGSLVALSYAMPGRADHHILILLCLVVGLGAAIRALLPGGRIRAAVLAGAAFGFGVWVSPEALIGALPVLAAAGLAWYIADDGCHPARQGLAMSLGLAAMVLLAIPVERPPAGWLVVDYDRVSVHHLVLALAMAAVFLVAVRVAGRSRLPRLAMGGAAALVAAGMLFAAFPEMAFGSLAAADATIQHLMHPVINEMQPLWPLGEGGPPRLAMMVGGAPFVGGIAILAAIPAWRRDGRWPAGLAAALALLAGLTAAIGALRFGLDLAAPAAIAAGGFPSLVARACRSPRLLLKASAVLAATILALATPLWAAMLNPRKHGAPASASCDLAQLAAHLDRERPGFRPGALPLVLISARFDAGPEISWLTPYRTVAGPYHRAGRAILDTHEVFDGTDLAAARAILRRRDVRLLLTCIHDPRPETGGATLRAAILAGTPPDWLQPVPLPPELADFRLFLVLP